MGTHTPQFTPPGSAPSHELQKPLKESGIFQSLGTICLFLLKGKVKRGPWRGGQAKIWGGMAPSGPPLESPLVGILLCFAHCRKRFIVNSI